MAPGYCVMAIYTSGTVPDNGICTWWRLYPQIPIMHDTVTNKKSASTSCNGWHHHQCKECLRQWLKENATSASCSQWPPPCVQVEYLLWWCHPLQLALVVFFLLPTGAHTPLVLEQLALCGDGLWWWELHVDVEVVFVPMGCWWFNGSSQNLRKNKETTKKHIPLARKAP